MGATVEIKGVPSSHRFCDVDGKYEIEVNESSTLKFSFIGLVTQEVKYSGQKVIDVSLKKEVYVSDHPTIAYTPEQRKRYMTSAVVVRIERRTDIRATGYTNNEQYVNGAMSGICVRPAANLKSSLVQHYD